MTRIVAGTLGGRRLTVPAGGTRPTSDRVREALFATLEQTGLLAGARVLDLCAGSGALAFEALSRGARVADLVESHPRSARVARDNARSLGLTDRAARVHVTDARSFVREAPAVAYDLIVCDPPYGSALALLGELLDVVAGRDLLTADGLFVAEYSARDAFAAPAGWRIWRERRYGETALALLEVDAVAAGGGGAD